MIRVTVILPTRNPHPHRFARTLSGLAAQSLERSQWELLIVDNGSEPNLALQPQEDERLRFHVIREEKIGLTSARLRGIAAARGDLLVFVDDDNILAPDFLANALSRFATNSRLAVAGGPVHPDFASHPPDWLPEFHGLLAVHEHGGAPLIAPGGAGAGWPAFAPVGAGLCILRAHALNYAAALAHEPRRRLLDRRGNDLSSGGDNDIVFTALHGGGDVGYFPELAVTHLIPASRLEPRYLARLNRGIQRSWVAVLDLHGQRPWPAIRPSTVPLRAARVWWRTAAWRGPVERIRFSGLLGRFEGQADLQR